MKIIFEDQKLVITRKAGDIFVIEGPPNFGPDFNKEIVLNKGDSLTVCLPPYIAEAEKA